MIEHTSRTVNESIFILPVKISGHDFRKRHTRRAAGWRTFDLPAIEATTKTQPSKSIASSGSIPERF